MSLNPHSKTWTRDLEAAKWSEPSTRAPSPLSAPPLLHHDLFHHDLPPFETDSSNDHLENLLLHHRDDHHDDPYHHRDDHHDDHHPLHSEKPHPTATTIPAFPHTPARHPVTSHRQLFLLTLTSSLTVGLGLGAAVGIWSTIHKSIQSATHHAHPHLSNWPAGLLMGFLLAPLLETSARAFLSKATGVLTVPAPPPTRGGFFSARATLHRLVTHLLTITSALIGLGAVKAVQMQYAPTRDRVWLEFPVFVVGFTFYGGARLVLETITWDAALEVERRGAGAGWGAWAAGVGREVGALYCGRTALTVLLRDALTFAVFPYLGPLWIEWWTTVVDPGEEWLWVPEGLQIGFFFTLFSTFKEVTAVLAVLLFGGK
ncbi:hypothetical protein QBC39DRAFT_397285 [Podospora conica]|nr:hypothetical protein QBC39DRAFT_397285 [Schizothecium conicum]